MRYDCCDRQRRNAVSRHATLNGIDYLELVDTGAPTPELRQRTLLLYLLKAVPDGLTRGQLRIEGGERIRNIGIEWIASAAHLPEDLLPAEIDHFTDLPEPQKVLLIRTDCYGDHSTYTLRLVSSSSDDAPPTGFDPRLCEVDFSFKVDCESDFDCRTVQQCPADQAKRPDVNYLVRDYPGFRRLILDRLSQLVPGWRERSAADLGVTLAELLAYVGDNLSYRQDAVATEAYLATARRRISLRRHALLVDYHLHNGCNARVWLHLHVAGDVDLGQHDARFYSSLPAVAKRFDPDSEDDLAARRFNPLVFEPMHGARLFKDSNKLYFYTWGDKRCCLGRGTTRATLDGHWPHLRVGDVLLFEEVRGPVTGEPEDADPGHRHIVRLTSVRAYATQDAAEDGPPSPLADPLNNELITEIGWGDEDRLPFALCISTITDGEHGVNYIDKVSVVRGNMVLADHGFSLLEDEELGVVPGPVLAYPADRDGNHCLDRQPTAIPARFNPQLAEGPLTFAGSVLLTTAKDGGIKEVRVPFDPGGSAAAALQWEMADTLPQITVTSIRAAVSESWLPVSTLLGSDRQAREFVVEVEHDDRSSLRFGDDNYGRRPEPGLSLTARYRVGNGRVGNVGAESISHSVCPDARIEYVRNPMAARGGVDMEDGASVRRDAPQAFRRQERAVTPADYAEVTERYPGVQRAAATQRWTGSWHTMFITVDRDGGVPVDGPFAAKLASHVERYRMAGHDTEFNNPIYVPLELELLVCVQDDYFRADVKMALLQVLGSTTLGDGRRGLFHPDNLSFGQTVYLSRIYAAARQVQGIASAHATCFKRQGDSSGHSLDDGFIALGRLEIPRLDNDANYPGHGVLRLNMYGGK